MSELPAAVPQNPACGACGCECRRSRSRLFQCEECELVFDPRHDFAASFLDPDAEPCGRACDNYWHGDHVIELGRGFNCGRCLLPSGHTSLHWTGCVPVPKQRHESGLPA
jgi:hypothetical protein